MKTKNKNPHILEIFSYLFSYKNTFISFKLYVCIVWRSYPQKDLGSEVTEKSSIVLDI